MDLPEFLSQFDEELKKYDNQNNEKRQRNISPEKMYQYLAYYLIEGSDGNASIKQAANLLTKDKSFIARLMPALEYVVAMTIAAMNSSQDEQKGG